MSQVEQLISINSYGRASVNHVLTPGIVLPQSSDDYFALGPAGRVRIREDAVALAKGTLLNECIMPF